MDSSTQRLLGDKLYDKRKAGALEIEGSIRTSLIDNNFDRIAKIVHQLCHDYAYAVHQPHARNGGLIGLAAAAIALGSEVARYLKEIVPPVLACFSDQDARVRYYACESMYNIAKVAKGEILVYFNDVFDALCKLSADGELSVKNGAELLDRLVKDIVSESAATYASMLTPEMAEAEANSPDQSIEMQTAFSLPRFIPLLQERINVLNPHTRMFLVSWITLLDSIPDLELVVYLPNFFGGLLKFLSDENQDVHTTTKVLLDRFLTEIKRIAAVKKNLAENKKTRELGRKTSGDSSAVAVDSPEGHAPERNREDDGQRQNLNPASALAPNEHGEAEAADGGSLLTAADEDDDYDKDDEEYVDDEWIPGQDAQIDYQRILDILVSFLSESSKEEVQVTTLKWIESFFSICPEDILAFTPVLLAQVLPALSHDNDSVKQAAGRVNNALMNHIVSLPEEPSKTTVAAGPEQATLPAPAPLSAGIAGASAPSLPTVRAPRETNGIDRQSSTSLPQKTPMRKLASPEPATSPPPRTPEVRTPAPSILASDAAGPSDALQHTDLDYEAAVNALTLQFLHNQEATRVAALAWLIMLHRKSPRRILAIQDATFPALLKTLSDPAEAVVTRDLLLLSQISKSSDDSYFASFMVNLLKLFTTDRRLLETRGNLIIRQLCLSLSAEKIYRTMAESLERDEQGEDFEFASIMVQNLNNNLITAPELQDLRKRLRNLDTRDGQTFFTVLFRAWCVNAVATFSLCLLAQAYEQAYNLLQIFAELEMTVNMLIQIDKLVQLLESPVFTYLRMQLLEPERFPHLYKCLYGLLMLLPQSSAFAALKNRLNSVSAIGYLHIAPRGPPAGAANPTPSSVSTFERQNRLKSREEGGIRWNELLDKFKATQERIRRNQQRKAGSSIDDHADTSPSQEKRASFTLASGPERPESAQSIGRPVSGQVPVGYGQIVQPEKVPGHTKSKSGLSQLGRLATGRKGKGKEK